MYAVIETFYGDDYAISKPIAKYSSIVDALAFICGMRRCHGDKCPALDIVDSSADVAQLGGKYL